MKARHGYGRTGQNNTAKETHLREMAAEQALKMAAMDFKKWLQQIQGAVRVEVPWK